jgi:RimJ/RimL family protein N-acetyltransferase
MGSNARKLIEERFSAGATLWLIRKKGHLAGYQWTIPKDPINPTYVPHTETDVHNIAGEVFKPFRDDGVYQESIKKMLFSLKAKGYKRFFSEAYLWNKKAIRAQSKTGLRRIGTARRFDLFGRNVVVWSDMINSRKSCSKPE